MDKRTLMRLFVGYCASVLVAEALLFVSFARGWIVLAPHDRLAGRIILPLAAAFGLFLLFLAIGVGLYVYRDARRRGMDPLPWTLAAVLIPYFLGLIVYLTTRPPLQATCPACGTSTPQRASFCPSCGRPLLQLCLKCQSPVQNGARYCHACGVEVARA